MVDFGDALTRDFNDDVDEDLEETVAVGEFAPGDFLGEIFAVFSRCIADEHWLFRLFRSENGTRSG